TGQETPTTVGISLGYAAEVFPPGIDSYSSRYDSRSSYHTFLIGGAVSEHKRSALTRTSIAIPARAITRRKLMKRRTVLHNSSRRSTAQTP
ncbi:hypothetical protein WG66_007151, partial [Moniliophthora roreri]